ncbi:MAG TPA: hypothetical protein VMV59_11945 [Candidatus Dormibacteraeota bacterium]|nr:hypothetical protein [Candidatus Acidoferrales bacterium]HVA18413.1 hypothetical protein [Candidatus Dormibacteraeota bacterium]
MDHALKSISKAGIPEAIAKTELYRYLNEPEEAESICHDILAIEPNHQLALRVLGLSITDQFTGAPSDRYAEVQAIFERLENSYERFYYLGLLNERRAKVQLRAGRPLHALRVLFEEALRCFAEAEKIRPPGNDDAVLRWNRCVRLLHSHSAAEQQNPDEAIDFGDSNPY